MIGFSLAQYAPQVLGIEVVKQVVEDTRWTSASNGAVLTVEGEMRSCSCFCAVGGVVWERASTVFMTCGEEGMLFWSGQRWVLNGFLEVIPIANLFFSIQKQSLREGTGPADRKRT